VFIRGLLVLDGDEISRIPSPRDGRRRSRLTISCEQSGAIRAGTGASADDEPSDACSSAGGKPGC